ncbi:MAG: tRNA 2-thiouridine(34) synthase MnmA [Erysipelotrichaceae bacterium]|jgi:tRNA-specific 2-thiouridylase|nr:tRNA 2-thiouridine(34) synthase MnmA [Erysipelotrichaceae bacterium]
MKHKSKVMIGLSGGVDSAVAGLLLKEKYDVVAGFMRNWDAIANQDILGNPTLQNSVCPQEQDYADAMDVAHLLDIPLYRVDFIKEYWDEVFTYFIDEYKRGRTPNPDVFCNKYIKFDAFLKFTFDQGAEYLATGHYARIKKIKGVTYLLKAKDLSKDQSYFLAMLSAKQLEKVIFPLGELTKKTVRTLAIKHHLSVATKKDSTGVCFIGERDFKDFLMNYLPATRGNIVDINTKQILGTHDGVLFYTLGQRHGLALGGIKNHDSRGFVVVKKDVSQNILYVASREQPTDLYSNWCELEKVSWLNDAPHTKKRYAVKFRYRQSDHPCTIEFNQDRIILRYQDYPGVTPGQIAVLYDGDVCLGGGIINHIYSDNKKLDI